LFVPFSKVVAAVARERWWFACAYALLKFGVEVREKRGEE
jgi:hypothetical protein